MMPSLDDRPRRYPLPLIVDADPSPPSPRTDQLPLIVDADPSLPSPRPSRMAPQSSPAVAEIAATATRGLGPVGRSALGIGIPFVVTILTASLLGAWSPSAPAPSGADSTISTLLELTWAASIVVGAILMRSLWALLVVPAAAIAGTFLGIALAMTIYTAAQFGLAAGVDPSRWPQGDPDGWFLVLVFVVPASILLAAVSVVVGRLTAAEVRWHKQH